MDKLKWEKVTDRTIFVISDYCRTIVGYYNYSTIRYREGRTIRLIPFESVEHTESGR